MQNSPNQQDQDQDRDQRKDSSMEDSPAMTIEFLRARLLAERSVSKTARQRADELAKRVLELEEQLKFVSLQRKKAEKATADVLAILETHGMSELSEEFDSSSDQEMAHFESKVGNNSVKEESSVALKVRGNDVDEFSGSELESVSLSGRSLSWKSGKDSSHSREKKYMNSSNRRRRSYASIGFESPKRVGKSCRQIRCRETRSADGDLQTDTGMLTPQANGATCSEGFLRVGSENQGEQVFLEGPHSGGFENQRDVTDADNHLNGHGSETSMERALEHQAELIERYEAEEKTQREWEEKFRENNSSTPDSCEPGNNSDITEERDEIKAPAPPHHSLTISSEDQEGKSKIGDVLFAKQSSESHINGFQSPPHVDTGCLQDKKCSSVVTSESPASDFVFPTAKGKHSQECSPSNGHPASGSSHHHLPSQGSLGNQSADMISSSHEGSSFFNKGRQNELALMPRDTSEKLGSVLDALQQAKLSLNHKLNTFPLIEGGSIGKAIEPSVPAMRTGDRVEVPVGCAGLFRVPTDSQFEANTPANFPHSGSRLSLTNYYPDTGYADDRFMAGPYLDSRPSVPADNQFLAISSSPYTEIRSTVPSHKPFFEPRLDLSVPSSSRLMASPYFESRPSVPIDNRFLTIPSYSESRSTVYTRGPFFEPSMDVSVPSSSRYTHLDPNLDMGRLSSNRHTYPSYPLYRDLMPRMPSNGALSNPLSSGETGIPPGNHHLSFYGDHFSRPNMYR